MQSSLDPLCEAWRAAANERAGTWHASREAEFPLFCAVLRSDSALPPTLTAAAEIEAHLLTFRARFAFALSR